MAHYTPPEQSKIGQLIDVIVLMGLSIGALFVPLRLGMSGAAKVVATPVENPTWETLGQTAAQSAQYEALGYTPKAPRPRIRSVARLPWVSLQTFRR